MNQYVRAPDGKLHIAGEASDGVLLGERACTLDDLGETVVHHRRVAVESNGAWTCKDCGFKERS